MSSRNDGYQLALASFETQFGADVAQELVDEFFDALNSMVEDLRQALSERQTQPIKVVTHRLIGLCPIYHADPIATLSRKIEDELPSENWTAIDEHCKQLFEEYESYSAGRQIAA